MKKALVFVTAFALVLVAGIAVAFMAAPIGDDTSEVATETEITTTTQATEKPTTTEATKEDPLHEELRESGSEDDSEESQPKPEEKDTTPPHLEILSPEDGQHFETEAIAVEGKTEPGAKVFAGKYEADVDKEGNWRIVLIFDKNGSTAHITAVDEAGNEAHDSVKAYYDPPQDEEPKEEPKEHDFSSNQKYGSCSEDPAYDVWYGTGTPGTKVFIASEFGSGQTTIGEKGKWDLKVKFYEAPCNTTFKVVLETDDGDRKEYEFTRICTEEGGGHDEGQDK